jgi:hypothetical protein
MHVTDRHFKMTTIPHREPIIFTPSRPRSLCATFLFILVAVFLGAGFCLAQDASQTPAPFPASAPAAASASSWSYNASIAGFLIPQSQSYAQPTFMMDGDWAHLEARYNNEFLQTASLWFGYDFTAGKKVQLDFTPMIGGVFGKINGIAPGFELTLRYWKLELYSASEYVFDTNNRDNSFFYTWTELSYSPAKWIRFGAASQRTRVYQTGVEVQRGPLLGFTYKKASFTTYVFNPGVAQTAWVLSLGYTF